MRKRDGRLEHQNIQADKEQLQKTRGRGEKPQADRTHGTEVIYSERGQRSYHNQ